MRIGAFLAAAFLVALAPAAMAGAFQTPVSVDNLDVSAFTQYVGGQESPFVYPVTRVLWTQSTSVGYRGEEFRFGDAKSYGPRALRIGFKKPIAVGSVLVRGAVAVSVLRSGAAYPGRMASDDDWIIGQRTLNGSPTSTQTDGYSLWIFPPGTLTRSLRFVHTAQPSDSDYAGVITGVYVLSERFLNSAPRAVLSASANNNSASQIANGPYWENTSGEAAKSLTPISSENPVTVTLSWPHSVTLTGLCGLNMGIGALDIQAFTGGSSEDISQAGDSEWRTVATYHGLRSRFLLCFAPNWLDFGSHVTARAIRIKITGVTTDSDPRLDGASDTVGGRRVWLDQLIALMPIGNAPLATAPPAQAADTQLHPPIPIHFTLAEPGYVTLVIEDASGKRVRNLVSSTYYPAGRNTAWWDGADDLTRDRDASGHSFYHIPTELVAPGSYHVRGLVHPQIDLRYELSVNSSGNPPWGTADGTGGWMTTHSPAQTALFIPGGASPTGKPFIYLGASIAEGGSGLQWVDLDGKKLGGRMWVGGIWTGAFFMARDAGTKAVKGDVAYVAAPWRDDTNSPKAEIRLTALTANGDRGIPQFDFETSSPQVDVVGCLGGIAAHEGMLAISLPALNRLVILDAATGKLLGTRDIDHPNGVAYEANGNLLALSGNKLVRFSGDVGKAAPQTVVSSGLDAPQGITVDDSGQIFISDWGNSHQVKVFSPSGDLLRTIGHPGAPKDGPYDPLHMNHPEGLAIDSNNHLWVAENDFQPKRVSVWDQDGHLLKAFYGPARYGGGGTLDPHDKSLFYYDGMAFKIDWATGESAPSETIWREDEPRQQWFPGQAPELALYRGGRQYFTNCYNAMPTRGANIAVLYRSFNGIAVPCAAMGQLLDWPLLRTPEFRGLWAAVSLDQNFGLQQPIFIWSDLNGDGIVQPSEVQIIPGTVGGVTVMPDLSFIATPVGETAKGLATMRYAPVRFTADGVPVYSLNAGKALLAGAQASMSDGGDQALLSSDGWTVVYPPSLPYPADSVGGGKNGAILWTYPNLWPGLGPSHYSPVPTIPGELIGATRMLGGFVTPRSGEAGPLWAVNGNMGDAYLFTEDGLFVAQLFRDSRQGNSWSMPVAERGMLLNDVSLHDENFLPSIDQTEDGKIYMVDGDRNAVVSIDGLEKIRRIPSQPLVVTAKDIVSCQSYVVEAEAERQRSLGTGLLKVPILNVAPPCDGTLDKWPVPVEDWAVIDRSGTHNISASVALSGDRLYAAFKTGDNNLLANSGAVENAPFKTGGALDIQVDSIPGGVRLLVTRKAGKTWAVLYRAKVGGTVKPVPFSSPWRTITIDRVDDVSAQVQLADDKNGNFVVSVPLSLLEINAEPGGTIRGDLGVLRGDGAQTLQRVYWNNKATAITADVPSEAAITPDLWGKWIFTSSLQAGGGK